MTSAQKQTLFDRVMMFVGDDPKDWVFHHGDCVGGDATFDALAEAVEVGAIHIHPGVDSNGMSPNRAYCGDYGNNAYRDDPDTVWYPAKPYLERNDDIAEASDVLIACPKAKEEQLRSGTWSTVRRARKRGKLVILIYPDGTVEES